VVAVWRSGEVRSAFAACLGRWSTLRVTVACAETVTARRKWGLCRCGDFGDTLLNSKSVKAGSGSEFTIRRILLLRVWMSGRRGWTGDGYRLGFIIMNRVTQAAETRLEVSGTGPILATGYWNLETRGLWLRQSTIDNLESTMSWLGGRNLPRCPEASRNR
jgi:hypothetical protein